MTSKLPETLNLMKAKLLLSLLHLGAVVPGAVVPVSASYPIYIWPASNSSTSIPEYSWKTYPEAALPEFQDQTNANVNDGSDLDRSHSDIKGSLTQSTAFHCSGGGTRAFTNCIGAFRALHMLDLQKHFQYLFGISGGSWFSFLYSFLPTETVPGTPNGDLEMLSGITNASDGGPGISYDATNPQGLTTSFLEREPVRGKEMLAAVSANKLWFSVLHDMFTREDPFKIGDWKHVWANALYEVFLANYGISDTDAFAWSIGEPDPDQSSGSESGSISKSDAEDSPDVNSGKKDLKVKKELIKQIRGGKVTIPPSKNPNEKLRKNPNSFPLTLLPNTTYRTVRPNRPFPVIGTTYVSLKEFSSLLPQPESGRMFTMNSVTPFYVGFDYARDVTFTFFKKFLNYKVK